MRYSGISVRNYKSFVDSGDVTFRPGINVIAGQNDAGKTAFVEALSLRFASNPHRTLKTFPSSTSLVDDKSIVTVHMIIERAELWALLAQQIRDFVIAVPDKESYRSEIPYNDSVRTEAAAMPFVEWVLGHAELELTFRVINGVLTKTESALHTLFRSHATAAGVVGVRVRIDGDRPRVVSGPSVHSRSEDFSVVVAKHLINYVYAFAAERRAVNRGVGDEMAELAPDCSNLHRVLHSLQANIGKFERFKNIVRRILPTLCDISVRIRGGQFDILLWKEPANRDRDDLAVSLEESGSGVSHVLAIAYLLVTSEAPRIIIVDEPQSFLHPAAARKLVDTFGDHPQHQYILSTHSPLVITASGPAGAYIVRQTERASVIESIDPRSRDDARAVLSELGSSLADVFGAEQVIWVEGPTEEICFPRIIQQLGGASLWGTAMIGVRNTGDLEGRDARRVFEIYERLSHGNALVPPALRYIFDAERRSEAERQDLNRQSRGRVVFLKRRMYENYLFEPSAIAAAINAADSGRLAPITPELIARWLDGRELRKEPAQNDADGARMLSELFGEVTETRVEFWKARDSVRITNEILTANPQHLQTLADELLAAIGDVTRSTYAGLSLGVGNARNAVE